MSMCISQCVQNLLTLNLFIPKQRIDYKILIFPLGIQHIYSSEFSIGRTTFETLLLKWWKAALVYFLYCFFISSNP